MQKPIENGSMYPDIIPVPSISDFLSLQEKSNKGRLDLVTLQSFLSKVLPEEGQPTREQMSNVIDALGQPHRLDKIVQSILADHEQLEQIALRSFGHSTGMERVELVSQGQFSLRLHFWMPGNGEPFTEDPHSHTYNFGSKVLSGLLVTDLFKQGGEEGANMNMFQIASQNTQQKPKPEFMGTARLQLISSPQGIFLSNRDSTYTMSHNVIHRVRQGDPQSPIITLNLRGGAVKDRSTFFRDEMTQGVSPTSIQVDVESRLGLLRNKLFRKT